jgi:tRNA-splicing ligase RtcB
MKILPVKGGVPLHAWLTEPLDDDVKTALARVARWPDVAHVAVMPDVHLAGDVCVGTVLATRGTIYPAAVGGDVGCGMAAVALDCGADVLNDESKARWLLDALSHAVPAMRHPRARAAPAMPHDLATAPLSDPGLERLRRRDGAAQFATLGRGNHFLEFQRDEADGRLWLMVHSGSRAMGPAVRDLHLRKAAADRTEFIMKRSCERFINGPGGIDATAATGRAYLHDAAWARAYASASRFAMVEAAAALVRERFGVKTDLSSLIACDHNHVARERHVDQELYVHRKGAARAGDREPGILPGSMGTASFHTLGRGNAASLCSSAHGAGRAMPREVARRSIRPIDLERQMRGVWFDSRHAAALTEEAPRAYKDVTAVMRAQRDLTRIVRRLTPVLVYKAT